MYDNVHRTKAATTVPNLDGSVYKDHQLEEEWDIVRESVYLLSYAAIATDLLQGTSYPTVSLVLPLVGKLYHIASPNTSLRYEASSVRKLRILLEEVQEARARLRRGIIDRFFHGLMDCKIEDFTVATTLDPRYKSFKFKCVGDWCQGWEGLSDKEDTWEPIEHLVGHEQDISAFRERRKLESAKEEAKAAAKKKARQAASPAAMN
ncbi:hypothetical protein CYMTET_37873 [Cymbomonas tetramitiformis]|uniref:Chromo domain-containing protein n=1 Tax=Cymbomonas tetramitiformis TaxID=36881 RepID=A0AAE0CEM4_9CHLO|nr:hypothetical protein CYMTET_37873 [Cymbomonas tetramitiformis]|eukprot:gene34288-biopygen23901